jgi:hypothetical protein
MRQPRRKHTFRPSPVDAILAAAFSLILTCAAAWCAATGNPAARAGFAPVAVAAAVVTVRETWWLRRHPLGVTRRQLLLASRLLEEGTWVLARDPDVFLARRQSRVHGVRFTVIQRITAEDEIAVTTGVATHRVTTIFTVSPVDGRVQMRVLADPVTVGEDGQMVVHHEPVTRWEMLRGAHRSARLQTRTGAGLADLDELRILIHQIRTAEPIPGGDQ